MTLAEEMRQATLERRRILAPLFKGPIVTCRDCGWRGSFEPAVKHYEETGHALTYEGITADLPAVIKLWKNLQ